MAASKLLSTPKTMLQGEPELPRTMRAQAGSRLGSRFVPLEWASLTTISVAPAAMAPSQAAATSRVICSPAAEELAGLVWG